MKSLALVGSKGHMLKVVIAAQHGDYLRSVITISDVLMKYQVLLVWLKSFSLLD